METSLSGRALVFGPSGMGSSPVFPIGLSNSNYPFRHNLFSDAQDLIYAYSNPTFLFTYSFFST